MHSGSSDLIGEGKSGQPDKVGHGGALKKPIPPLVLIEYERRDQHHLCNSLELLADQLPESVDGYLCESIYEKLRFDLPVYHRNEEALYLLIGRNAPPLLKVSPILEYVRKEHTIHNCYADELYEPLQELRTGGDIQNSDTIGYMLRCCFETMRRHLEWEDLTLMPLAGRCLTAEDQTQLSKTLAKNRKDIGLNIV